MELTKELLEQRIELLETQRVQLLANANACGGAVTMLRQLITELTCEEPEKPSDVEDGGAETDSAPLAEGE